MEKELSELKSVLRSLVVSSPTQVDVRSLMRDYKNMVGTHIPISKYGYKDPVTFLKERFKDCFVIHGVQSNPVLTLIVPDTLKHIDEFVQRQRISSTTKFKGKRRSIPEPVNKRIPQRNSVAESFNMRPNISAQKPPMQLAKTPHKIDNNDNDSSYSESIEASCKSIENLTVKPETQDENSNAVRNFFKRRMKMSPSEYLDNDDNSNESSKDSGRQSGSSNNSLSKQSRLEKLKAEIYAIIEEAEDGIWCTDLIRLYRERYKRELDFNRFGYTSIISVLSLLDDAVSMSPSEADGDWLLSLSSRPVVLPPVTRRRLPPSELVARRRVDVDVDDALPGIDFDPDVFPSDCMHFLESIPSPDMTELEPGAMIELMIGEVYSPSHFWFIRLGKDYNIAMEDTMDEMNKYYGSPDGSRRLARGAVRVGHYCASLYDGDWHRSLIVAIIDSNNVKVRHVDYGTVERVSVGSLRPLRRVWASLPAQAARARLAGARPAAAGLRWQHAAAAYFLMLVRNKRFYGNVTAALHTEDTVELFLIDTSSDDDVCISAELIRAGHADTRPDSCLGTSESYLFPRFEALESGATPNYGEIYTYLRDGINLEYVDEYRMHVPSCLPQRDVTPPPNEPSEPEEPKQHLPFGVRNRIGVQSVLEPRATSPEQRPKTVERSVQVEEPNSTSERLKEEEKKGKEAECPRQTIAPPPGFPRPVAPFLPNNRFPPPGPSFFPPFHPPPSHPFQPNPFQLCNIPSFHPYPQPPQYSSPFGPPQFMPPFGHPQYSSPVGPSQFTSQLGPPQYSQHFTSNNFLPNHVPNNRDANPNASAGRASQTVSEHSPPPPYNDLPTEPRPGLTLSPSECDVFCLLSKVDGPAANIYVVEAINRAKRNTTSSTTPVSSTLNPNAAEFCSVTAETQTEDNLISLDDPRQDQPQLTPAVRLFLENVSQNFQDLIQPPAEFENL